MSESPRHKLPLLVSSQAQKTVTLNEALLLLDALSHPSVVSAGVSAQPSSPPVDGTMYILPAGKTGTDWGSYADQAFAVYRDGSWHEIKPRIGLLAYVEDEARLRLFDGSAWTLV